MGSLSLSKLPSSRSVILLPNLTLYIPQPAPPFTQHPFICPAPLITRQTLTMVGTIHNL